MLKDIAKKVLAVLMLISIIGMQTVAADMQLDSQLIDSVSVSVNSFDPTSDERVSLSTSVEEVDSLEISVLDNSGRTVKNILSRDNVRQDTYRASWDGTNRAGATVGNGTYTMVVYVIKGDTFDKQERNVEVRYDMDVDHPTDAPVIGDLYASPRSFNPDNGERTTVYFDINAEARLTVVIKDSNSTVKTLAGYDNMTYAASSNHHPIWDGRNEQGRFVTNGVYTVQVTARNSNGSDTKTTTVVVEENLDRPEITNLTVSPSTFYPDRDSNATIRFDIENESRVTVAVKRGGSTIRTFSDFANDWKEAGTHRVYWNGQDNDERDVNAGTYTVEVTARNNDGVTDTETATIRVEYEDEQDAPEITNLNASPSTFDPEDNEDTEISFRLSEDADVTVRVRRNGNTYNTLVSDRNYDSGLVELTWDGEDEDNDVVNDGTYTIEVRASNNDGSDTATDTVTVDTDNNDDDDDNNDEPNITSLNVSPREFDPSNDERTRISFSVNEDARLTVQIRRNSSIIREFNDYENDWYSDGTHSLYWNGEDDDGDLVSDGTYSVRVTATNSEGTDTETATVIVDKDHGMGRLSDPDVTNLTVSPRTFDPEDDEETEISFRISEDAEVTVKIKRNGSTIRTLLNDVDRDSGTIRVDWNGEDSDGDIVRDGTYSVEVYAENSDGSDKETTSVYVDTDGNNGEDDPDITSLTASPRTFDPDDDEDTEISFRLSDDADVTVRIKRNGSTIRTLVNDRDYDNGLHEITWNGKNSSGHVVNDGTYTVEVRAENSEGSDTETTTVVVDTNGGNNGDDPDVYSLDVDPRRFDPEDNEDTEISFRLSDDADVTVRIKRNGSTIRTLVNDRDYDNGLHEIKWNGEDSDGDTVRDGTYTVEVKASNSEGSDTETTTVVVDTDGDDDDDDDDNDGVIERLRLLPSGDWDPAEDQKLEIRFTLNEDVDLLVLTAEKDGEVVELFRKHNVDADDYMKTWNGRDNDNHYIEDGTWTIRVRADHDTAIKLLTVGEFKIRRSRACGGYWDMTNVSSETCRAITWATENGIFQGYADGTFRPNQPINRAQAMKVALEAFEDMELVDSNEVAIAFTDVDANEWYMPYLRTAKQLGLIIGYDNGTQAKVARFVNRVELLKLVLKASEALTDYEVPNYDETYYTDVTNAAEWFFDFAGVSGEYKLFGNSRYLQPERTVTRSEAATVLYRMNKAGLLD